MPHPTSRSFYPTDNIIANHMYIGNGELVKDQQRALNDWVIFIISFNFTDFVWQLTKLIFLCYYGIFDGCLEN